MFWQDYFVVLFLILQDFLIQNGDYGRLFKGDISVTSLFIFESILSTKQGKKLHHLRQHLSSKQRGLMDGTKGHSFIYKF
jgi:hypothetical protein